jgi:hypothetical protein
VTEHRTPDRPRGGYRHEGTQWSAGLPPEYGRRGSNSHGQGPPAPEAGASTDSATPAREPGATTSAALRSPVARSSGPRRARTVTLLLAGELHCHSCSGPKSAGQESNLPCLWRLGYNQVPSHDGNPRSGSVNGRGVACLRPDPFAGDLFSCQGAISERRVKPI